MKRSATILLVASLFGHAGNYAFYLLCARWLGADGLSALVAMTSLGLALLLPASGAQAFVAQTVSRAVAAGRSHEARDTVARMWRLTAVAAVGIAVAGGCLTPWATTLWSVTAEQWALSVTWFATTVALQVSLGALQGTSSFVPLAAILAGPYGAFRAIAVVAITTAGGGVAGALGALVLSSLLGLAMVWRGLGSHRFAPGGDAPDAAPDHAGPGGTVAVAMGTLMSIGLLVNADTIIARVTLSEAEAGIYAAAALFGKIAFHAPSALALVLLPTVTMRATRGEPYRDQARAVLLAALALGAATTVVVAVTPVAVFVAVLGDGYAPSAGYVAPIALAMTACAVLYVHATVAIAVGTARAWTWWVPLAVALCGALAFGGTSIGGMAQQLVWVMVVAAIAVECGPGRLLVAPRGHRAHR